jgi:hypothetical protein
MAIQGNITVKNVPIAEAYIKITIGSVSEKMSPVFNSNDPPEQTGTEKIFLLNYHYECRADRHTLSAFEVSSNSVEIDLEANIYSQAYLHLATLLNVSPTEV